MKKYNGSLIKALLTIYPEIQWKPWKFSTVSKGFWSNVDNRKAYFESIASELNLKGKDEWNAISNQDIVIRGGGTLLLRYGSLLNALQATFPERNWNFMGNTTFTVHE